MKGTWDYKKKKKKKKKKKEIKQNKMKIGLMKCSSYQKIFR